MNVRTLRKEQQLQQDPDVETPKLIHGWIWRVNPLTCLWFSPPSLGQSIVGSLYELQPRLYTILICTNIEGQTNQVGTQVIPAYISTNLYGTLWNIMYFSPWAGVWEAGWWFVHKRQVYSLWWTTTSLQLYHGKSPPSLLGVFLGLLVEGAGWTNADTGTYKNG
jgi:hypothetical protein